MEKISWTDRVRKMKKCYMESGRREMSNMELKRWINPLNAELNPICHLLALLGAHHILHFSRIKVNCIGHILCRKCLLEHVIEGNV